MPRKSTKKPDDSLEKKLVNQTFAEISVLIDDQVAAAVAELVREELINTDGAERVTVALQSTTRDAINRVRAVRGI